MGRFEGLYRILTLRCDEASRLASESLDHALPAHDRLALKLHRWICRSCDRYGRQIVQLRAISARLAEQVDPPSSTMPLPDEARDRIKEALKGG